MSDHICTPGCTHGITEENRKDVLDEFDPARRSFLRNTLVGGGAVGLGALGLGMTPMAHAASGVAGSDPDAPGPRHYYIPATPDTVLWGYFSKVAKPVLEI